MNKRVGERGGEPAISVVIATMGRAEKLGRSLAAFDRLDPETPAFEVIVVLDGHDPATRAAVREPHHFPLRLLEQPHRGNGPAKNLGAGHALAPYLLFLNDDTRPDPGCLLAHWRAQSQYGPCVLVGGVEWEPGEEITPYMTWLAPNGHLFNFSRLAPRELVHWDACWGAHLGLPRDWHLEEPFDPAFPYPSLEDTECGFRLARRGRPIRYEPDARCFHDHRYDGPADYRRRARISGSAARYTVSRHPELLWPLILRPAAAAAVSVLFAAWPGRWRRGTLWDLDYRWNFVWGVVRRQSQSWLGRRGA
ncbi:MAG: glycosyltransferase [Thermoanaerobaculaceae bacterium]|nr:glycosyltransferase [Thermoanaerobaculaceae bacterium]